MVSIQADEHVPRSISEGLKQRGIDIYTVEDEGIKSYDDRGEESILEIAREKDRVVLTNDSDFEAIHDREDHRGIIFIKSQYAEIGEVIKQVTKYVDTMTEEEFKNSKIYVP